MAKKEKKVYCRKCMLFSPVGFIGHCLHKNNTKETYTYLRKIVTLVSTPDKINEKNDCSNYLRKIPIIRFFYFLFCLNKRMP